MLAPSEDGQLSLKARVNEVVPTLEIIVSPPTPDGCSSMQKKVAPGGCDSGD
jgi:hypothetical protein